MELPRLPQIDWVSKRYVFFTFSGLLIATSLASIALRGFNYAIDFTGGTLVQVSYTKPKTLAELRQDVAKAGHPEAMLQSFAKTNSFNIRIKSQEKLDAAALEEFTKNLQNADPNNALRVDRREYVGPSVGRHLKRQAFFALFFALAGIVAYVAFRFTNPLWGTAGVLALFHDVLATAGLFSLLYKEIDLVIVAALLTIAGYSINDTIVIFDRMRERMRIHRKESLSELINNSINETMSRTLITNACVIAMVLILFLFGGAILHDFATAMLFGGFIGTYSTVAIATPLVYQWETWSKKSLPQQTH
jgi:preprotein translocase subunit SecF